MYKFIKYKTTFGNKTFISDWVFEPQSIDDVLEFTLKYTKGIANTEFGNMVQSLFKNFNAVKHLCTAITVLADERVWNLEKYPNYDPYPQSPTVTRDGVQVKLAVDIKPIPYEDWVEHMGGEAIVKLRELIFSKRLAQ